jgi:hypothetical protein
MDFGKLLSEAWKITWRHKVLWVFGLLASCAASGLSGGNGTSGFNFPSGNTTSTGSAPSGALPPLNQYQIQRMLDQIGPYLAVFAVLACVVILIGLIAWAIGIIGRGALVAGIDQAQTEGGTSFGKGWAAASAKFKPLFGMNLLLALPGLLMGFVAIIIAVLSSGALIAAISSASSSRSGDPSALVASIFGAFACFIPLACVGFVLEVVIAILRLFGERAIMLEGLSAMDGLKRGWAVFRANAGNSLLLGIMLVILGMIVGFVIGLAALPIVLPIAGAAMAAGSNAKGAGLPAAGLTALSVCGIFILAILSYVVRGALNTFCGACWNMAYRQFITPNPMS